MMLREVGIPSRNVMGFVGGTYNRFSRNYTVREGDAWKIQAKQVNLIDCDQSIRNPSIIL